MASEVQWLSSPKHVELLDFKQTLIFCIKRCRISACYWDWLPSNCAGSPYACKSFPNYYIVSVLVHNIMLIVLSLYLPYMLVAKLMGLHKHRTTRIKIKSSCLPTPWVTYSWLLSFLQTSFLISYYWYLWVFIFSAMGAQGPSNK